MATRGPLVKCLLGRVANCFLWQQSQYDSRLGFSFRVLVRVMLGLGLGLELVIGLWLGLWVRVRVGFRVTQLTMLPWANVV